MQVPGPCQAEKVQLEFVDGSHDMNVIRPDCGLINADVEC